MPLTSVAGGSWNDGDWPASAGFGGPGSSRPEGLLPLIRPSGGRSGLPKVAAPAMPATPRAAAEAVAPNRIFRRDKLLMWYLKCVFEASRSRRGAGQDLPARFRGRSI